MSEELKPCHFLPKCAFNYCENKVTKCGNPKNEHYQKSCSKRCQSPQPLLSCPFCGGEAEIITGAKMVLIQCRGESPVEDFLHQISTIWFYKEYKAEAITAWNTRTDEFKERSKTLRRIEGILKIWASVINPDYRKIVTQIHKAITDEVKQ